MAMPGPINSNAMESFSFATSDQLKLPLSVRVYASSPSRPTGQDANVGVRINLEGSEGPIPSSVLVDHPELKHIGSNQKYLWPSALS